MAVFPSLQATQAFVITPSDTVNIKDDTNNTEDYPFVFLHNIDTGATCRVLPAGQTGAEVPITIFLPQGATFPLAVRRVFLTSPAPPSGLIGMYGKQN